MTYCSQGKMHDSPGACTSSKHTAGGFINVLRRKFQGPGVEAVVVEEAATG